MPPTPEGLGALLSSPGGGSTPVSSQQADDWLRILQGARWIVAGLLSVCSSECYGSLLPCIQDAWFHWGCFEGMPHFVLERGTPQETHVVSFREPTFVLERGTLQEIHVVSFREAQTAVELEMGLWG